MRKWRSRNGKGGLRKIWGRREFAMIRRMKRMEVRTSAKIETGNVAERIQDGYNDIDLG